MIGAILCCSELERYLKKKGFKEVENIIRDVMRVITSHSEKNVESGKDLTSILCDIVKIADELDKGCWRLKYKIDLENLSAKDKNYVKGINEISDVIIINGRQKPVKIEIILKNDVIGKSIHIINDIIQTLEASSLNDLFEVEVKFISGKLIPFL